jgi:hypothetical protein
MKIECWTTGNQTLWVVIESAVEGREKEAAFATKAEAIVYRDAVRAARRAIRQGADVIDQMAALAPLLAKAVTVVNHGTKVA